MLSLKCDESILTALAGKCRNANKLFGSLYEQKRARMMEASNAKQNFHS